MKRSQLYQLVELLKQFGEEEVRTSNSLSIIKKAHELVEDSLMEFNQLVDDSIRSDEEN